MRRIALLAVLVALLSATAYEGADQGAATAQSLDGTYEYVGGLKGQAIIYGGRFVFLYGAANGSRPMIAEAGTYEVIRDTVTNRVVYSTDSTRIGLVYRWIVQSWSADTANLVVLNEAGQVIGRGRSVKRR